MTPKTPFFKPYSTDTNGAVFLTTGRVGNVTTGFACYPVVVMQNDRIESYTPACTHETPMSTRMQRLERNPKRAAGLARARARLGQWMGAEPSLVTSNLASLRLKAGLSQSQLAQVLDTSQPNVARMEKGTGNPTLASMRAWAGALGVNLQELIAAIDATQANA